MKRKFDANLIISIGVLIASFSALYISMKQAKIMNQQTDILLRQTKASSWPYLNLEMSLNLENSKAVSYQINVSNDGTGPALIDGIKYLFKDRAYATWDELVLATGIPDSISIEATSSASALNVIPNNKELILYEALNPTFSNWLYNQADHIAIEVTYSSVFEETWTAKRDGFKSDTEPSLVKALN